MNRQRRNEAKAILKSELNKYRHKSFESLRKLMEDLDGYEVRGPSGTLYQLEVQAMWDDKPGGNLRVMAGIDDGSFFSALTPLSDSFILTPDGEFLGE